MTDDFIEVVTANVHDRIPEHDSGVVRERLYASHRGARRDSMESDWYYEPGVGLRIGDLIIEFSAEDAERLSLMLMKQAQLAFEATAMLGMNEEDFSQVIMRKMKRP